jgi:hypothetical protein
MPLYFGVCTGSVSKRYTGSPAARNELPKPRYQPLHQNRSRQSNSRITGRYGAFYFDKHCNISYCSNMSNSTKESYYIITYREPKDGQIVTLKARSVSDSSLGLSFIALSDFIFDTNGLVVNPAEEDLKKRFAAVKTLHLSIYTVLSIEEVGAEHKGLAFEKDKSNLVVFPTTPRPPKS